MNAKLCRYCRRFVGKDGKNGICARCWQLGQGAVEVVVEAAEILAGIRTELTPVADYTAQRRRYWQMQARGPRRSRAAARRPAA